MYSVDQIERIHAEISTVCQAGCIDCSRLIEIDDVWHVNTFCDVLNKNYNTDALMRHIDQFPSLSRIDLCGNNGDPMAHPHVVSICERLHTKGVFCTIATNGALGTTDDYRRLAKVGVEMTFGIDGLEDTNHIYRRGVMWHKLMQNVGAFIDSGGLAEWQWLDFPWTRHQIEKAKALSEQIGFENFFIKGRNNPNLDDHIITNKDQPIPRTRKTLPSKKSSLPYHDQLRRSLEQNKPDRISCESYNKREIYLQVDGSIWPCCWLPQEHQNSDAGKNQYWRESYQPDFNNLHNHSAHDIIQHDFFQIDLKNQNAPMGENNVKFVSCIEYCGSCLEKN